MATSLENIFVSNTSGDEGVIVWVCCVYSCILSQTMRAAEEKEGDSSLGFRMVPTAVMTSFPTTAVHCRSSSILMPAQHFLLLTYTSQAGGTLCRTQKCPQILLKQFSACKLGKKHRQRKRAALVDFLVYTDLS